MRLSSEAHVIHAGNLARYEGISVFDLIAALSASV
jgi:hypothetical protein